MRLTKRNVLLSIVSEYIYLGKLSGNLNYWYNFGSILGYSLIIQIVTGVFLAMYYIPDVNYAFNSVEYIMREVNNGWLIRYIHSNGASFFFIAVYLHILKSFIYSSYVYPRHLTWYIGVLIFILMIIIAFLGYSLVWGQMSFWGVTVITSLFTVIPYFGPHLTHFLWGGFSVGAPTLTRFYALHFLLPFLLAGLIIAHLITLHNAKGSNPLGVNSSLFQISFHPYYSLKDFLGFVFWTFLLLFMVSYFPNVLSHTDNYIPANPLVTPEHIVPEWYLLPFYAILRSIPNKVGGVLYMANALIILFFLPFTGHSITLAPWARPYYRIFLNLFVLNFILLAWIGQSVVHEPFITLGFILTNLYFIFIYLLFLHSILEFLFYYLYTLRFNF